MAILRNHVAARWDLDQAFQVAGLPNPFPRGITFADIDGETEINGHYLVMEGKRNFEEPSTGQVYTMDARVRDGRTCVVVYGEPPIGIVAMRVWGSDKVPATVRDFWSFVHAWAEWAERAPRPEARPNAFVRGWASTPVTLPTAVCLAVSPDGSDRCSKAPAHDGPHAGDSWVWPQAQAS